MPRAPGQIDLAKTEAILDAAAQVFGERGLAASMEEIARRARVSKQTIYNHYGSKPELIRAIVDRRVSEITAPLLLPEALDHPEDALVAFGRSMLSTVMLSRGVSMLRMTVEAAAEHPDLARAFFEAGPATSRRRLAEFLQIETANGPWPWAIRPWRPSSSPAWSSALTRSPSCSASSGSSTRPRSSGSRARPPNAS